VLLLEVDLRRPTIARQMSIRSAPGLSEVLIGAATVDNATQSIDLASRSSYLAPAKTLDVIVAGMSPPNPGALIESHAMERLLEEVKSRYDLIVIDTPPLTAVSDAFPLLGKVDGVVIVGWIGRNRRDVAHRLHETLNGAGAPLLGVVANGFKSGLGAYGYDYEYGEVASSARVEPTNGASPPASIGWRRTASANGASGSSNGADKVRSTASRAKRAPRKPASSAKS
jgi:capsular exopolysaccharide synthesis family protein